MTRLTQPSRVRRHVIALFVLLIAAISSRADAQTPSLSVSGASGGPGANVTVTVSLANNGGTALASIEWDLTYSSTDLSAASGTFYATGAAASAAGKMATCNNISAGDVRCVVAGLNTSSIGNGALATITLQIAATTVSTSSPVGISNANGADGAGNPVALTGSGSAVTITQPVSPVLSSLACTPSTITPPGASLCTVSLNKATPNSLTVALSSGNNAVQVPASVNMPAGSSATNFTATAPSQTTITTAVITASLNGLAKTVQLTLTPATPAPPAEAVTSLTCSPATVTPPAASLCTVSLTGAVSSAASVALSSNNNAAQVPATLNIAAGLSNATFSVSTLAVNSNTQAVISASLNGSSQGATIILTGSSTSSGTGTGTSSPVGLAAAYGFNEGSGSTAADSSGHRNTATLVNGPAWVAGKYGDAISANGINQYVLVPPIDYSTTKAITVSAWVNRQYSTAGGHVLFEYSTNFGQTNAGFGVYPDDSTCQGIMAGLHGNAGYSVNCYSQPSSGVWHYLTVIYDKSQQGANQVSFYVDGVLQAPTRTLYSANNTNGFGTHALYIFSRAGQQQFTQGIIDEMRIYRRALSAAEIQSNMSTPVSSN